MIVKIFSRRPNRGRERQSIGQSGCAVQLSRATVRRHSRATPETAQRDADGLAGCRSCSRPGDDHPDRLVLVSYAI